MHYFGILTQWRNGLGESIMDSSCRFRVRIDGFGQIILLGPYLQLLDQVAEKSGQSAFLSPPFAELCTVLQFWANQAAVCSASMRGPHCGLFGAAKARLSGAAEAARAASTDSPAASCSTAGRSWSARFDDFIIGYNYRDLR